MEQERFAEILKEYGFSDHQINLLWNTRPKNVEIEEDALRATAQHIKPKKTSSSKVNSHRETGQSTDPFLFAFVV
jgi:hypothetical protein